MSADETAAIIGRMMLERKNLRQQEIALDDELRKVGESVSIVGRKLRGSATSLEESELSVLSEFSSVSAMVSELRTVRIRITELDAALERAGF